MGHILPILVLYFTWFAAVITPSTIQGGVEGKVVLSSSSDINRDGFKGRYGRPSGVGPSSANKNQSSPVLVWIEGSSPVKSSTETDISVLNQKDRSFDPKLLAVPQNGTVRILNSDPVYHNVFSLSKTKQFDVGHRPQDEYMDITFDKPGIVDVFCDIHANMHAVIYILPPTAIDRTVVGDNSTFKITDLDPGDYTLRIYAIGYNKVEIPIQITNSEILNVGTVTVSQ